MSTMPPPEPPHDGSVDSPFGASSPPPPEQPPTQGPGSYSGPVPPQPMSAMPAQTFTLLDAHPLRRPKPKLTRNLILVALAAVLVAGGAVAVVTFGRPASSDDAKIRTLIDGFADAVYSGDSKAMSEYLCSEEAGTFLDSVDPASEKGGMPKPSHTVFDVTIHGEIASARLEFEPQGSQMLYFRQESGQWRVCAPAEDQIPH